MSIDLGCGNVFVVKCLLRNSNIVILQGAYRVSWVFGGGSGTTMFAPQFLQIPFFAGLFRELFKVVAFRCVIIENYWPQLLEPLE